MAKIQLSGLPESTESTNTDLFHVSKSGVDYRITRENILLSLMESVEAVDGDSVALDWADTQIVADTTTADASITIPDGDHLGQQLTLSNQGSYLATYTHSDFSYGIIVDTDHNPVIKWVSDGAGGFKWDVGSQITADYIEGGARISLRSDRVMIVKNQGSYTTTLGGGTFTFSKEFNDTNYSVIGSVLKTISPRIFSYSVIAVDSITLEVVSGGGGAVSEDVSFRIEGDYA